MPRTSLRVRAINRKINSHATPLPPVMKQREADIEAKEEPLLGRHSEKGLPAPVRIRDAMARLLASESICVATALVEGELCITANELHSGSRENRTLRSISEIAHYFKALCGEEKPSKKYRENVFQKICSHYRMLTLAEPKTLLIREDLPSEVAHQVLHHEDAGMGLRKTMRRKKSEASAFGLVYGACTNIDHDFSKVEESIKHAKLSREGHDLSAIAAQKKEAIKPLHKEQFEALSKFKEENILRTEKNLEVHAEMQMLSHIFSTVIKERLAQKRTKNFKPQTIYIGISKLCCMRCGLMIEAANKVLEEKKLNITLKVRGGHGLHFEKWESPEVFEKGYHAQEEDPIPKSSFERLVYSVGKLAKEKIAAEKKRRKAEKERRKALKIKKPALVSQIPSQSESDAEPSIEDICRQKIEALEEKRKDLLLSSSPEDASTILEEARKTSIAIQLYTNVEAFKLLLEEEIVHDYGARFSAIKREFAEKYSEAKTNPELLLKTLQDKTLVGEEISAHFKWVALAKPKPQAETSPPKRTPLSPLFHNHNVRNGLFSHTPKLDSLPTKHTTRSKRKENEISACTLFGLEYTYEAGRGRKGEPIVEISCNPNDRTLFSNLNALYMLAPERQVVVEEKGPYRITVKNIDLDTLIRDTSGIHGAAAAERGSRW